MLETNIHENAHANDVAPEDVGPEAMEPSLNEIEALEAEVVALKADNQALKDQALRYAAETENVKRRSEREMNDARAYAITRFARDLLGVADTLSRAVNSAPKDIADAAFKNFVAGIEMTEKEMISAFDKNNLKMIAPLKGDRFDPNLHQAVMEQASTDVDGGCVIMMMQTGYELFGRVVRPAMVAVAAKKVVSSNGYAADGREDSGVNMDSKA
jgi:molecular chaperone GrpE